MKSGKVSKKVEWYNNPSFITVAIICLIGFIIILSQSFAINSNVNGFKMFGNVLNHNISYMIVLLYFISLETRIGRKYFNYTNLLLILLYFIIFITSILTVFQSLSLTTLLGLVIDGLLVIYLSHSFFRDTRIWKEFKLEASVFNELTNDWYFNAIVILKTILFIVNLVFISSGDGAILALLDFMYIFLFTRYIYLYRKHLIAKDNKSDSGSIDSLRDTIDVTVKKVGEVYKEHEIDKKLDNLSEKVSDVINNIEDKIEESKVGEKLDSISDKVGDVFENISSKTESFLEENHVQEKLEMAGKKVSEVVDKIDDKVDKTIDKIGEKFNASIHSKNSKVEEKNNKGSAKKKYNRNTKKNNSSRKSKSKENAKGVK